MTRAEAMELIRIVRGAFLGARFDRDATEVWLSEFRRVEYAIGELAVRGMIVSSKRPTLADFHEQCSIVRERTARERRDRERREEEEEIEGMPRPPLREIPEVVEFLRRFSDSTALPEAPEGQCEDGCGRSGLRVRIGRFAVCSECARKRLRAGEKTNGNDKRRAA